MRAINHSLTGALIGLSIGKPVLAVPLALASHFICDVIPHHGEQRPKQKERVLRSHGFRNLLIADTILCVLLVAVLAVRQPLHWQLACVCAFAAAAPDLLWINRYRKALQKRAWRSSLYAKFAGGIQWFQRPIGAVVEAVWFIAALVLISPFLIR